MFWLTIFSGGHTDHACHTTNYLHSIFQCGFDR